MLDHAEQAGPDLAVGSESDPVAMTTKRFTHWSDDADFTPASRKGPALGRRGKVLVSDGAQLKAFLQSLEQFAPGYNQLLEPGSRGVERHEFDETHGQASLTAKFSQV